MRTSTALPQGETLPDLVTVLYACIVIACSRRTLHRLIANGHLTVYRPTTAAGHSLIGQVTLLDKRQVHDVAGMFRKGEISSGPVHESTRRRRAAQEPGEPAGQ